MEVNEKVERIEVILDATIETLIENDTLTRNQIQEKIIELSQPQFVVSAGLHGDKAMYDVVDTSTDKIVDTFPTLAEAEESANNRNRR